MFEDDGFAQVFSEHKYFIVECMCEMGFKTDRLMDRFIHRLTDLLI